MLYVQRGYEKSLIAVPYTLGADIFSFKSICPQNQFEIAPSNLVIYISPHHTFNQRHLIFGDIETNEISSSCWRFWHAFKTLNL